MPEDVCEVVITAPDPDWLAALTRDLVELRLAACGHILPAIRAIYRWDEAMHDDPEARVALHTRESLVDPITAHVREHHPYVVPCVISVSIASGNPDYLQWVIRETTNPALPNRFR
ncbi:MAG TPA: divalent-cation tolerance protein CutA [Dermatophilaceae bacterium]|nr:divalent-cation tolerance protein CutA [Dermatophilaceae bacterium]